MKFSKDMTVKKAVQLIYTISGTIIICFLVIVMASNFLRDSRVFGKNIDPLSNKSKATASPDVTNALNVQQKDMDLDLDKYDQSSNENITNTSTPSGESVQATPAPTVKTKILVHVINYTGDPSIGETIRTQLEQNGYFVASESAISSGRVSTKILEKHSADYSQRIYNILNMGKIMSDFDPNSKYDVEIILGDDFQA